MLCSSLRYSVLLSPNRHLRVSCSSPDLCSRSFSSSTALPRTCSSPSKSSLWLHPYTHHSHLFTTMHYFTSLFIVVLHSSALNLIIYIIRDKKHGSIQSHVSSSGYFSLIYFWFTCSYTGAFSQKSICHELGSFLELQNVSIAWRNQCQQALGPL